MSKVHFIDTSVLVELLDIPEMNERYEATKEAYRSYVQNSDVFILPVAVLVETGNHISHIADGNRRREIAAKFAALVTKAVKAEDNWNVIPGISDAVLNTVLYQFPDRAMAKAGFGDISIIEQFEEYWKERQPIGEMWIWTYDAHLQGYSHIGGLSRRKNK